MTESTSVQEGLDIIKRMNDLQAEMEELDEKRTRLYGEYHRLWTRLDLLRETRSHTNPRDKP